MEIEKTEFGSTIKRELTNSSLRCFEAMDLGNGWRFLGTADGMEFHATWMNPETNQLLTYCEGDLIIKQAPDNQSFECEVITEMEFCING